MSILDVILRELGMLKIRLEPTVMCICAFRWDCIDR